jgi:hypothetical protein
MSQTPKLHWFNSGHEEGMLRGIAYTPKRSVVELRASLSLLPLWYGDAGDYVIVSEDGVSEYLLTLPELLRPALTPVTLSELSRVIPQEIELTGEPWGISPQSVRYFDSLRYHFPNLHIPECTDRHIELTGRRTSVKCSRLLRDLLPEARLVELPVFCRSIDELRSQLQLTELPCVLKRPYSCSGRGIHWLRTRELPEFSLRWIRVSLSTQKELSIERGLPCVCNFGMEFYSDGCGSVNYLGLSVFSTVEGCFTGCELGSESFLESCITQYVSHDRVEAVRTAVLEVLRKQISYEYRGYLGVDMMIYHSEGTYYIHPMVEINLRYTMGILALKLSARLGGQCGRLVIGTNTSCSDLPDANKNTETLRLSPAYGASVYNAYIILWK